MFREINTETIIENRMFDNVPSDIDRSEGSFIYDAVIPTGKELAAAYINMDKILNMAFASTAAANRYSTQLELRCSEVGVSRKAGTLANGTITFDGADGTIIPAGTLIQSSSGLQFSTLAIATIASGTATVNIKAVIEGTSYNLPSNSIIQAPIAINGVTSITNAVPTTGGTAKETDSALLERYLLKVQTPATSGNQYQYKIWALEVDGCGSAKVYPLDKGPGTVKVVIANSDKRAASQELIESVTNHIEENRPIGATVTVTTVTEKSIIVAANVQISSSVTLKDVQSNFTKVLESYLKDTFNSTKISIAKVGSLLLSIDGVLDLDNLSLKINNETNSIILGDDEIAVLAPNTPVTLGVM